MGFLDAIVSVGAGIIGNLVGADDSEKAARNASRAQTEAAKKAIAEQKRVRGEIRELLQPYTEAGEDSLFQQLSLVGALGPESQQESITSIQNSPLFQDLIKQQENTLLQNASATGQLRGGNTQRALAELRPALLSQEINNQYGRLGDLTALGYGAAGTASNAIANTGANISNLQNQIGAYQAGGFLGEAKARNSGLSDLAYGVGQGIGQLPSLSGLSFLSSNSPPVPIRKPF